MGNYDKQPCIRIRGHRGEVWCGYQNILQQMETEIHKAGKKRFVLVIDCYPGVFYEELKTELICPIQADKTVFTDEEIFLSEEKITARVKDRMTEDRVFGQMCLETYTDILDNVKTKKVKKELEEQEGLIVIYGAGASLLEKPDLYIYADMARWEIQCRFRKNKIQNWKDCEKTDDNLMKFKWGYFFSWRVADRHKKIHMREFDYLLDTNIEGAPKLLSGEAFRDGLEQAVKTPFRVVPFFDPGVWGGQWMKEVCNLDRNLDNYAWCFDCVPEENSLLLENDGVVVEVPSLDLVFYKPRELLGEKVYARFGAEFPIRFDFLDTMDGQNLSLQVHPLVSYIQEKFGIPYTQEESYYILDAKEESHPVVYLGVKSGVKKEDFLEALRKAQSGEENFLAEEMVNAIPVKKHDHLLIPPGTIHCSGKDTMVLEISSTPYIFTFKLWDWGRLGLDGKPRPIHIEHGSKVIQFERDTDFVYKELVNQIETLREETGRKTERTGLHKLEFIESIREWFDRAILCNTQESVNVLNLVEGNEITVSSPTGEFPPYTVHYAETFIIPEQVGEYCLIPGVKEEGKCGVICARVKVK